MEKRNLISKSSRIKVRNFIISYLFLCIGTYFQFSIDKRHLILQDAHQGSKVHPMFIRQISFFFYLLADIFEL